METELRPDETDIAPIIGDQRDGIPREWADHKGRFKALHPDIRQKERDRANRESIRRGARDDLTESAKEQNRGLISRPTQEEATQYVIDHRRELGIKGNVDVGYEPNSESNQSAIITVHYDNGADHPYARSTTFILRKSPDGTISHFRLEQ